MITGSSAQIALAHSSCGLHHDQQDEAHLQRQRRQVLLPGLARRGAVIALFTGTHQERERHDLLP